MKRLAALVLLSALATSAQAHERMHCDIRSDYSMRMHGQAFVFTRDAGPAKHIAIGGGRLFVDGDEVRLSADDRTRIARFESELNTLLPKAQKVAVEATDIAFAALTEVARGFAADGKSASIAKLEQAHARMRADLARKPLSLFSEEDIADRQVGPVIREFVPVIVGGAVSSSLGAVLSGDEKKIAEFERRMDRMGDEIERKVEKRAEALEPLVESLCESTRELDRIEQGLALRLENGKALDLLRTRSRD
jgi:hypothetical protein